MIEQKFGPRRCKDTKSHWKNGARMLYFTAARNAGSLSGDGRNEPGEKFCAVEKGGKADS